MKIPLYFVQISIIACFNLCLLLTSCNSEPKKTIDSNLSKNDSDKLSSKECGYKSLIKLSKDSNNLVNLFSLIDFNVLGSSKSQLEILNEKQNLIKVNEVTKGNQTLSIYNYKLIECITEEYY